MHKTEFFARQSTAGKRVRMVNNSCGLTVNLKVSSFSLTAIQLKFSKQTQNLPRKFKGRNYQVRKFFSLINICWAKCVSVAIP